MKKLFILFSVISLLSSLAANAQPLPKDAWLWTTIDIDKKLSHKVSLIFSEEVRMYDNMSRLNLFFTNIGVSYRVLKFMKLSLVYRFTNKTRDEQYLSHRHRLYFDIAFHKDIKDFTFIYRFRVQGQVRDYYSSDDGKYIESYMRHKFDVQYNYKRFTPYLAAEFRFQFTNPSFPEGNGYWNRERFYAGSDYKLNKKNSFGLYYMIQRDMNNKRMEMDYTIGVEYSLSL